MSIDSSFWAGTEQSLHQYLLKDLRLQKEAYVAPDASAESAPPRLLSKIGSVGIVSVYGPLNNSANSYMNEYRGATGYPEIRAALVQAAQDPEIGAIVLDVNSGGGMVSGVNDTSDLIRKIDTSVKPVVAHTDGMTASAAYWLASSARTITGSPVAEVGSIGVLTIHQEVSKMMADMGITAKVLRAGKFKAMGNPYEPLTAEAEAVIQAQLDQMYTMFLGYVAERRGLSYEAADRQLGQGRMFIGERGVTAGLLDGLSNFDEVVSKAQSTVDKKKSPSQYGLKLTGTNVKTALTEQAIAAMAESGADAATIAAAIVAANAAATTPEAVAAKAVADAKIAADAKAAADATTAATAAAAAAAKPAASADLVTFLQTSLATAQAAVATLTVAAQAHEAKVASLGASLAAFRVIAATSVERMSVALGVPPVTAADDTALLAQHAGLREKFEKTFKVGGVAAVSSAAATEAAKPDAGNALRMKRIEATRTK